MKILELEDKVRLDDGGLPEGHIKSLHFKSGKIFVAFMDCGQWAYSSVLNLECGIGKLKNKKKGE